jgi:RNA polymerase sigma-70 factor (ECF subfamily)
MHTTSASLLERLQGAADPVSWERFVNLYTRLLFYWGRRLGLQESDAADLVQDVFATLVQQIPKFRYNRDKSFRNWLRTILVNKWREHQRRVVLSQAPAGAVSDLAVPDESQAFDEVEYRQHIVRRALELMQAEFSPKTWKACWEHVVVGRSAGDVAAELGISVGSVYVAKSRVLGLLRQELCGLFD